MPLAFLSFLKIAFATWGLLQFHTKSRIVFSMSVKNATGILIGRCLESVDCFGYYSTF